MKASSIVAIASLDSIAYAQTSQQCQGDVCFQLNIPDSTASSGTGNIFFQLSAPTSYSWVGLGQGSSMSGSNMFVMYQSADGSNVTLSPRLGSGHQQPQRDTSAEITLLDGSGVSGGQMIANVRCGNCDSWSGGSMDFTSSSGSWIYAGKSGSPIQSDEQSESISQHGNGYGSFSFDFTQAQGGSSANPFAGSNGASSGATGTGATTCTPAPSQILASVSGSGCPTAWPTEFSTAWPAARPTWAASCYADGGPPSWPTNAPWRNNDKRQADDCVGGSSGANGDVTSDTTNFSNSGFGEAFSREQNLMLAHGVMASLAFLVLFPTGGILIRVASFTGLIWIHALLQVAAYLIYIVAFGMGVWIADHGNYLTHTHPIIGIVLFAILLLQPLSGLLHHKLFRRYNSRTAWSYWHIGIGRIAIILGMVNGGLGLQLASNTNSSHIIAYAVVAGIFGSAYLFAIIFGERKRKSRAPPTYQHSQRRHSRHGEDSRHRSTHRSDSFSKHSAQAVPMQGYYAKRDRR